MKLLCSETIVIYIIKKLGWYNLLFVVSRYTLQASTFQMAVLLQFNVSDSWTIALLKENTQIRDDYLIQVIQILLKAKLITCEDDESELSPASVVHLYLGYKK